MGGGVAGEHVEQHHPTVVVEARHVGDGRHLLDDRRKSGRRKGRCVVRRVPDEVAGGPQRTVAHRRQEARQRSGPEPVRRPDQRGTDLTVDHVSDVREVDRPVGVVDRADDELLGEPRAAATASGVTGDGSSLGACLAPTTSAGSMSGRNRPMSASSSSERSATAV